MKHSPVLECLILSARPVTFYWGRREKLRSASTFQPAKVTQIGPKMVLLDEKTMIDRGMGDRGMGDRGMGDRGMCDRGISDRGISGDSSVLNSSVKFVLKEKSRRPHLRSNRLQQSHPVQQSVLI